MDSYKAKNPILLITYKRVDTLQMIIKQIAKVKPTSIYIANNSYKNEDEKQKVIEVREFLDSAINWQCKVQKLYRESHLSAKLSISSAISWFFSCENQGIILEDDCLPTLSFFRFCDELLERYKRQENIFMISGWSALDFALHTSVQTLTPKANLKEDYYFSKYNHIWGWASWARAWKKYQLEFYDFQSEFQMLDNFCSKKEKNTWYKIFKAYALGKIDTWDYPWTYSIWKHNALCIYPKNNMITNIGFNSTDATHTKGDSKFAHMPAYELHFPLNHQQTIKQNKYLDKINFKSVFNNPSFYERVFIKLKKIIKLNQKI